MCAQRAESSSLHQALQLQQQDEQLNNSSQNAKKTSDSDIQPQRQRMMPRNTSPLKGQDYAPLFQETSEEIRAQPDSRMSYNRRQVISKMMLNQSEHNDKVGPSNDPLLDLKLESTANHQLINTPAALQASGKLLISSSRVYKTNLQLESDVTKAKQKQQAINTELSDDDSEDNERNGRLPSRCNSEIMSQKYEASESPEKERLASEGYINLLEDGGRPYEAIYDNGKSDTRNSKLRNPTKRDTNRSLGPASSSSTKHKQPTTLKMILLENVELSEKNGGTGRHTGKKLPEPSITPRIRKPKPAININTYAPQNNRFNQTPQNNQELKVIKMQTSFGQQKIFDQSPCEQQDSQKMRFYNRQKTKKIQMTNSWNSIDVPSSHSHEDSGDDSKTGMTVNSGPDRSTTSHFNIKLPPTMSAKRNSKIDSQIPVVIGTAIGEQKITVGPMDKEEARVKPKIKPISLRHAKTTLLKSGTFSPQDQLNSRVGSPSRFSDLSKSNKKGNEPQADLNKLNMRRTLTTKERKNAMQKQTFFSQTSPMNSIRGESKKDQDEDDASITEGDYKNFVIDSSPGQKQSQQAGSSQEMCDEQTKRPSPHDKPPAAVQKISFGVLPTEVLSLTSIQRASLLNDNDLRKMFSVKDQGHRLSLDSQQKAFTFYNSNNQKQAISNKKYNLTTKIQPKSISPQKEKSKVEKVKMISMPQTMILQAHNKIEKISQDEGLSVIMMKLWQLSFKADDIIDQYQAKQQGRTIFEKSKREVKPQEGATRRLPMRTLHHLLASISLGVLLVKSEIFHLHDSIFLLKILSKNQAHQRSKSQNQKSAASKEVDQKPVCSYDQFKLILLSLFGERIFILNERDIDVVLRQTYKQITASGEPCFQQKKANRKAQNELSQMKDSLMIEDSQQSPENSQMMSTSPFNTMSGYGEVKELNLLQLSDLIKMTTSQSRELRIPEMISTMECVLGKFHLAVHKEIKYTDYRTAFTELQIIAFNDRKHTYAEDALKKYQPENPWDRWKPQMSVQLDKKPAAAKAEDPKKFARKFDKNSGQKQTIQPPRLASKGRLQNFNFSKVKQQEERKNKIASLTEPSVDQEALQIQATMDTIAGQGMIIKIDEMIKQQETIPNDQSETNKFKSTFASLNHRLQQGCQTKKRAFLKTQNIRTNAAMQHRLIEEQERRKERDSMISDPLRAVNPPKTLLHAVQTANQDPFSKLSSLIQPNQGQGLLLKQSHSRPNSTYMTQRLARNERTASTLTAQSQPFEQMRRTARPNTQNVATRNAMNNYFKTIGVEHTSGLQTPTAKTAITGFQGSSTNYSELDKDVIKTLRYAGQYKPMLSGTLSPNPNTGQVRAELDRSNMSIVVRRDGGKQKPDLFSQIESQCSSKNLSSIMQTLENKPLSIIYGGRGKSALQNKIGLEKTAGQSQFERQYFQYPIEMSHRSKDSQETLSPNSSQFAGKIKMRPQRNSKISHTQRLTPNPVVLIGKKLPLQDVRRDSDLAIDGMQQPILSQESKRGMSSGGRSPTAFLKDDRVYQESIMTKNRGQQQITNINVQNMEQQRQSQKLAQDALVQENNSVLNKTDSQEPSPLHIKRDSTLNMHGFNDMLQKHQQQAQKSESRRGTELITPIQPSQQERELLVKKNTASITLNIETVIKTKTKVGLTHQENTVEEISTQKKLPLPGLQKTTTLLLKH